MYNCNGDPQCFKNDGCRDEGICVFSAGLQSVLAFVIVAELAEFAFSVRIRVSVWAF